MNLEDINTVARHSLEKLRSNVYPGRGIVIGKDETGLSLVQVYWIMGRSDNSRNRVFGVDGGRLFTEPADPSKVKDPSLIIYNVMDDDGTHFVVSNGKQTDTVVQYMRSGNPFESGLTEYCYEPDFPNFTPRITGVCGPEMVYDAILSVLRRSLVGDLCDRLTYRYERVEAGFGFCITTYSGDGNPLPSFMGEPFLVSVVGDIKAVAETYWETLNETNRVSLAVRFISKVSGTSTFHIINKFKKV